MNTKNKNTDLHARRVAAYRAGEYVIPTRAFDGPTFNWGEPEWIRAVHFTDTELNKKEAK